MGPPGIPERQTVYTYFHRWKHDGTRLSTHDDLYALNRFVEGRSAGPSELIVDSQSIKTATMISQAVGYDGAKPIKGRKRPLTIDTFGLVLRVLVTAANVPEREGSEQVLKQVKQMGNTVQRVHTVWVEGLRRGSILSLGYRCVALGRLGRFTP